MKKIYKTVLLIYCCLMIYLLFLERIGTNYDGYNLVPFDTIRQFFYMAHGSAGGDFTDFALRNLLGNVFMFLPFALFPLVFKKLYSFLKYLVFCFVTILLIELVQFATHLGSFDIDDIILNICGALIGYAILVPLDKMISKYFLRKEEKPMKNENIISENQEESKYSKKANLALKVLFFFVYSMLYCAMTICAYIGGEGTTYEHPLYIFFALIPFALLLLLEWLTVKKTGISPIIPALGSVSAVVGTLAFSLFLNRSSLLIFHGYAFFVCAVRILIGFIQSLKAKKKALAIVLPLLFAGFMYLGAYNVSYESYDPFIFDIERGTPDRTNSWNSINQIVLKDESWEKIVTETEFTLGEGVKHINDWGETYYSYTLERYPNLDGSTVCVPMAVEFARQHLGLSAEDAKRFVNFSTTHYAYEFLIDRYDFGIMSTYTETTDTMNEYTFDESDLVIATQPSDEELEYAKSQGVELVKKPVCYDAFVFITHKDNPIDSLTVEQIKDIYKGKIKNWKQVGGKNEKIVAFQREKNSGSQTAMEKLVMGGADMIDPIEIAVVTGMGELVEKVAEYENETASIGYTYRYYIDNLYKNDNIKTIKVDGIAPTDENIRSGKYPFTTNYYGVYIKDNPEKTGELFLDWILSDEGQKCVKQAGYITMK